MKPPEDGIGDRIRQARDRLGLSQARLSERTKERDHFENKGIPRSVLVGYESGKFKPGARELRLLCDALEVDIKHLLYGQEDDVEDDIARSQSAMHVGLFPRYSGALRIAFSLLRLKQHEKDAFGALILGMVNRTFKTDGDAAQLWELAELVEWDLVQRLADGENGVRQARQNLGQAIATGEGLPQLVDALRALAKQEESEVGTAEPRAKRASRKSV